MIDEVAYKRILPDVADLSNGMRQWGEFLRSRRDSLTAIGFNSLAHAGNVNPLQTVDHVYALFNDIRSSSPNARRTTVEHRRDSIFVCVPRALKIADHFPRVPRDCGVLPGGWAVGYSDFQWDMEDTVALRAGKLWLIGQNNALSEAEAAFFECFYTRNTWAVYGVSSGKIVARETYSTMEAARVAAREMAARALSDALK